MRNIEKEISLIKNKVAETEKSYQGDQGELEKLSDQLAKKITDNMIKPSGQRKEEIEEITNQVKDLKNKVGFTPRIIEALKNKIALLEKEQADLILKNKIEEQKELGKKLVSASKLFVESIREAQRLNKELRGLWDSWNSQKEETGFSELPGKTSMFSYDLLNYLGILCSEYEGKEVRKREYFNRIRL